MYLQHKFSEAELIDSENDEIYHLSLCEYCGADEDHEKNNKCLTVKEWEDLYETQTKRVETIKRYQAALK